MGQTQVDLLHLLEDLRDAYPGAPEETVLTEIVANSLDSGAHVIHLAVDPAAATLMVVDDGSGMQRRELARYHDIATSSKTRGAGIGFAGVGIKLGLLLCDEVLTETRRGRTHVATRWHLASRNRAPWKWVEPPGLVPERGTAVRLKPANALSPLLDRGYLEGALRRHFEPLFNPSFDSILEPHYKSPIAFVIDGAPLGRAPLEGVEAARLEVRLARKRKPSAVGYLLREPASLPEHARGVAVSTLGKIIKRGWDWLAVSPAAPERIGGVIEVPALAACLTLNKADFIRSGPRGATYLSYRKAIQEAVSRQLAEWGDARDLAEETRRRAARPVERDLERVLVELAEDFPLLAALVEHRAGGQRRLPMGAAGAVAEGRALVAGALIAAAEGEPAAVAVAQPKGEPGGREGGDTAPEASEPRARREPGAGLLPGATGPRRPQRYGLSIQYESRPDSSEMGWLVESTVWVNESHPAHARAVASRSDGYHLALTVAMALAPLAVEPAKEHEFVNAFMARWGEALSTPRSGMRSRR